MEDIILNTQDMTWLNWSLTRNSSGTAGTFLKAYDLDDGHKVYYKLSDFDPSRGVVGHECVNELIAARLLKLLGFPHLEYKLIHADINVRGKIFNTWLAASFDFKQAGEDKIPIETFYSNNAYHGEAMFDFCLRMGWGKSIYEMLVFDFLILNRDRHGANMEVLRNRRTGKVRLTPLFDNGLSLVFSCKDADALGKFDVLEDKRIQSFVGGNSARKNLKLIPQDEMPALPKLREREREVLFMGLENTIGTEWLDKIWEMISRRRRLYEDLRSKRLVGDM